MDNFKVHGWDCIWTKWVGLSEVTGTLTCSNEKKSTFGLREGEFDLICDPEKCNCYKNKSEIKTRILNAVKDLVSNFMYYDRKEDEDLSTDALVVAFKDKIITVQEVLDVFKAVLDKCLEG